MKKLLTILCLVLLSVHSYSQDVVKCQDFLLRDLCGLLRDSFLMNEDLRIKKVSRYLQENESKEEN